MVAYLELSVRFRRDAVGLYIVKSMPLQRMVVLPALSRPMMMMRICSEPSRPLNNFEKMKPIFIYILLLLMTEYR